ncbi:MAG: MFS transporter [Actinobacteria bacterium]|nr:MAG: MFS transporter [Actinomycetota bacterium]
MRGVNTEIIAHPASHSHRAYFGVFLVVGVAFGLVGPSISLLAEQVGTTIASVGIVLVTYGLGYIIGTQIFARGYDKGYGNRLIGTALLTASACLATIPFVSSRIILALMFLFFGTAISTSDVGCNTLIVWELKERVGPRLALMHTMFGVGAILSPLIVRGSDAIRGDAALAFWIAAAALSTIAAIVLFHKSPVDPHLETRASHEKISTRQLALIVMFFLGYVALEVAFVTWIYTYGIKTGLSKTEAAILTSTFWVGFMVSRFATVFLARRSHGIVFIQIAALTNIAVCVALYFRFDSILLPCAFIYGVAAAPQFPLMFSFIGSRTSLSGKTTARIVGTAGVSSMTLPWVAGQLLERVAMSTYPIFLACTAAVVFVGTRMITKSFGIPQHISKTN